MQRANDVMDNGAEKRPVTTASMCGMTRKESSNKSTGKSALRIS